ncbi:MAG: aminoglycoside phosphotransferase family protein [Chloroflexota bacterium]
MYGDKGLDWLDALPALLDEFTQCWSLTLKPPFEPFSYNYVLPAVTRDGRDVVLKTGFPDPELLTEIYALRHYAGQGSVQILESNPGNQIMLLERVKPGDVLLDLDDDDAMTLIAARVMQQLWKPIDPTDHFPASSTWMRTLDNIWPGSSPITQPLVEAAQRLKAALLKSETKTVLLHGDLHHWNILSAQRQPWLAVDPKGIVGDPVFDVGALLRNPVNRMLIMPDFKRSTLRRLDILAEVLGFERQRMLSWSFVQAILAAHWSYEINGDGWDAFAHAAQVFFDLLLD